MYRSNHGSEQNLSPNRGTTGMRNVQEIAEAVRFIEEHLVDDINIKDVADAIGFSLFHFSRTFNTILGHSPYDYIMRRRLSEAAKNLLHTDEKIIDVALKYQFNNPETFSRAFRKMFGRLPTHVRKNRNEQNLIFKTIPTIEYLIHINQGDYLLPKLMELDAIFLVGFVSLVKKEEAIKSELTGSLLAEVSSIKNRKKPEKNVGISFYTRSNGTVNHFYMAGFETDSLDDIPPSMVGKIIPAHSYARFIHKGPADNITMTLDYIYQTWMPKSGCCIPFGYEIEQQRSDFECDVYVPVTKI